MLHHEPNTAGTLPRPRHHVLFEHQRLRDLQVALSEEFSETRVLAPKVAMALRDHALSSLRPTQAQTSKPTHDRLFGRLIRR